MPLTAPPSAPPAAPAAPGDAPARTNPTTFRALADSFVVWQVGFRTSIASLRAWLADYITWAGTHVTEMNALQADVTTKSQTTTDLAAATATSVASMQAFSDQFGSLSSAVTSTSASQAAAAGSAVSASASAASASSFASAAQAADGSFADQAGGRAATADGQSFLVRTSDLQVYQVYRRDSAGASTLLGTVSFAPVSTGQTAADANLLDAREMLDPAKMVSGFSVLSATGALSAFGGLSATPMIPVVAGSQFVVSANMTAGGGAGIAYYGASGTYVSGAAGVTSGTAVTVPAGAYFVRFSVSSANVPRTHMYRGSALPSTYKDFAYQDRLTAHSKMVEWLGELMTSLNLFDSSRATDNFAIDSTDGSVDAFSGWYCSDYMPVQAGGSIYVTPGNTAAAGYGISWYDIDRTWLSGTAGPTTAGAYTVPAGAAYARINNTAANKGAQMVVPGSSAPSTYRSFPTADLGKIAQQVQAVVEAFNSPQNIFDASNVTVGALRAVGTIDAALTGFYTSGFLPVTPGGSITTNFAVSGTATYGFVYYALDKSTIVGTAPLPVSAGTFSVPTNAYYVRVTLSTSLSDYAMVYRGASVPAIFTPHPARDWGYRAKRWIGADFGIIGDSITASNFWQADVCKYLGATLAFSDGVNGRQMAGAFSDAATTNATSVGALELCGVFLGTNDFGNSRALGSFSDAAGAASFVGDTRTVLETLIGWNPTMRLFVMTSLHRLTANTANAQGLKLVDYVDMLIRVASDYGVPVLDLYRTSGMNALNATANTISNDGLHPTSTMAPIWIGKPLRAWLENI